MSKKVTRSFLKHLLDNGAATCLNGCESSFVMDIPLICLAYSVGTYGLNGKLLFDSSVNRLYVITERCSNLFATPC